MTGVPLALIWGATSNTIMVKNHFDESRLLHWRQRYTAADSLIGKVRFCVDLENFDALFGDATLSG